MEILLDRKIGVDKIGPELLSINRASLNLQLNLSQIPSMTLEEQQEIEERISAKMSSVASPANAAGLTMNRTPKSNRTISL
mmetsp:Transcript_19786/g.26746  ORF Transcript_19786/g.26746 Transcript_19786/m.26746 type:complete len:81 (-) Transcript_19786:384-626(-)